MREEINLLARIKAVFFPAYRVAFQGRAGIRYREGKRVMSIDSEILVGEFDMAIYLKRISCWLPPMGAFRSLRKTKIESVGISQKR